MERVRGRQARRPARDGCRGRTVDDGDIALVVLVAPVDRTRPRETGAGPRDVDAERLFVREVPALNEVRQIRVGLVGNVGVLRPDREARERHEPPALSARERLGAAIRCSSLRR